MKKYYLVCLLIVSLFMVGCSSTKSLKISPAKSFSETSTIDVSSTTKYEGLNFGDSLEKVKASSNLIYVTELPSLDRNNLPMNVKSYSFKNKSGTYYRMKCDLVLNFFNNELYEVNIYPSDFDSKEVCLKKYNYLNSEFTKTYGEGIDRSSDEPDSYNKTWRINDTSFSLNLVSGRFLAVIALDLERKNKLTDEQFMYMGIRNEKSISL